MLMLNSVVGNKDQLNGKDFVSTIGKPKKKKKIMLLFYDTVGIIVIFSRLYLDPFLLLFSRNTWQICVSV